MMHALHRDKDDIISDSIRSIFVDLDFVMTTRVHDDDCPAKAEFEKRLKKAKLRMIATDSLIRKVRVGEIEMKQLKEMLHDTEEAATPKFKKLVRLLDLLTKPIPKNKSQKDMQLEIEMMDIPEDEKQILLFNKRKELKKLRKDTYLIVQVMFGKSICNDHSEILRKEFQKIKPYIKPPMQNYEIYK